MVLILSSFALGSTFNFVVVGDTQTDGSGSSVNMSVFPTLIEDMNRHDPALGLLWGIWLVARVPCPRQSISGKI